MMSTKKRDTYLTAGNVAANNPLPDATLDGNYITITATPNVSGRAHTFLHMPTHKWLRPNGASSGFLATRTAQRIYLRGLKVSWSLNANDGSTWWHRRIAFYFKGDAIYQGLSGAANIGAEQSTAATRSTWQLRDLSGAPSPSPYNTTYTYLVDYLFKGTDTIDWISPFTAAIDNTRVTAIYDKYRIIGSGNASARPRVHTDWISFNKSIQYDEDETGIGVNVTATSTNSKLGCGDVYVVDFFAAPSPVAGTSSLGIQGSSTLYWHEK